MPLIYLVVETLNQLYELVFTIYSERPGDGSLDCDYFEALIPMPPWVTRMFHILLSLLNTIDRSCLRLRIMLPLTYVLFKKFQTPFNLVLPAETHKYEIFFTT